ncbi:MAG: SRPBCC domain-containing protein [Bacteroidetes bacterium]|nr:SRPBCC domain-containing protein [Bacteroidota bacterium]
MDVSIDFELPAPVEAVWRAWTEPEMVLRWFGSKPDGVGLRAELDVRVGGDFLISFRDTMEHTCYGVYAVVDKPKVLGFSWNWKSEPGVTSQVMVRLEGIGNGTRMHFTHDQVGTASAHDYQAGWMSTFEKLRRLLGG